MAKSFVMKSHNVNCVLDNYGLRFSEMQSFSERSRCKYHKKVVICSLVHGGTKKAKTSSIDQ